MSDKTTERKVVRMLKNSVCLVGICHMVSVIPFLWLYLKKMEPIIMGLYVKQCLHSVYSKYQGREKKAPEASVTL